MEGIDLAIRKVDRGKGRQLATSNLKYMYFPLPFHNNMFNYVEKNLEMHKNPELQQLKTWTIFLLERAKFYFCRKNKTLIVRTESHR